MLARKEIRQRIGTNRHLSDGDDTVLCLPLEPTMSDLPTPQPPSGTAHDAPAGDDR